MDDTSFYSDDCKLIYDIIREQWNLGPGNVPNIAYIPNKYPMDTRVGSIWVYRSSRQNDNISSTSYESVNRTARISIKVASPNRDIFFQWSNEVIRCLMAVRRSGIYGLGGYNYLEVNSDNEVQNEFGFWAGTIEVKLVRYCKPIESSGMARSPFNKNTDA